jgi:hypothetical protein
MELSNFRFLFLLMMVFCVLAELLSLEFGLSKAVLTPWRRRYLAVGTMLLFVAISAGVAYVVSWLTKATGVTP